MTSRSSAVITAPATRVVRTSSGGDSHGGAWPHHAGNVKVWAVVQAASTASGPVVRRTGWTSTVSTGPRARTTIGRSAESCTIVGVSRTNGCGVA